MNDELLTIWMTASIRKFINAAGVGVPVRFLQMSDEDEEPNVENEVRVITAINFPRRGSLNEVYSIVNIQALVKTAIVKSDVYFHTRVKARVARVLNQIIPVTKIGGSPGDTSQDFNKARIGYLRPLPTKSVEITAVGVDDPDASVIEVFYELQTC